MVYLCFHGKLKTKQKQYRLKYICICIITIITRCATINNYDDIVTPMPTVASNYMFFEDSYFHLSLCQLNHQVTFHMKIQYIFHTRVQSMTSLAEEFKACALDFLLVTGQLTAGLVLSFAIVS